MPRKNRRARAGSHVVAVYGRPLRLIPPAAAEPEDEPEEAPFVGFGPAGAARLEPPERETA